MNVRCGTVCFATDQGIGILTKQFRDHGIITDACVVRHGTHPTHEDWHPGAFQINDLRRDVKLMEEFCLRQDVMMFIETPFRWELIPFCREHGVKTVIMSMHECMPERILYQPDLWLCPSLLDLGWATGKARRESGKDVSCEFLPVPVDTAKVPWRKRERVEVFVHNAGHGGLKGRNGTAEFMDATWCLRSPANILIRSQESMSGYRGVNPTPGGGSVRYEIGTVPYEHLWTEGDVFVFPEKFNGLSLPLQEARAAGMLVMCGDRFPMNTWLPKVMDCQMCLLRNKTLFFVDPGPCPDCGAKYGSVGKLKPLIPVKEYRKNRVGPPYTEFDEALFNPKDIAAKIDEWYGRDIRAYSESGREWAEANSWERLGPKYKELLEGLR